jgi:hypothetical protein
MSGKACRYHIRQETGFPNVITFTIYFEYA